MGGMGRWRGGWGSLGLVEGEARKGTNGRYGD